MGDIGLMKILLDEKNCYETLKTLIFIHVPKCAGTYTKSLLDDFANTSDLFCPNTEMHQPMDEICGYRTSNGVLFQGLTGNSDKLPTLVGMYICSLRNPYVWYDSYFYFKNNWAQRNSYKNIDEGMRGHITPLSIETGDYKKAIENSLRDEHVKSIGYSVLAGGFCPSVWMKEFDIGYYTAWILYLTSDHKLIFENSEKIRRDRFLNPKYVRDGFNNIHFYDVDSFNVNEKISDVLYNVFNKRQVFEEKGRIRQTKYDEDYLKCFDILKEDKALHEKFMWKERFVLDFYKEKG